MNSITGVSTIGIIGFGTVSLSGRIRVPIPAANITAFIASIQNRLVVSQQPRHERAQN